MSIAAIYEPPSNPNELQLWSFTHMAHHRDIIRRIQEVHSEHLDEYVLDPFNPMDMQTWLEQHQVMHQAFGDVLGIAISDLSELDWQDQDSVQGWFLQNGNDHFQAGQILQV